MWHWYIAQLVAALYGSRYATCPPGYLLNGVRAAGVFACMPRTTVDPGLDDPSPVTGELWGRVWCRDGETPIAADFAHVACQSLVTRQDWAR